MWTTLSSEINAHRQPAPTTTLSENWGQFSWNTLELIAGGTMKHIYTITPLTLRSKYTEQGLSTV